MTLGFKFRFDERALGVGHALWPRARIACSKAPDEYTRLLPWRQMQSDTFFLRPVLTCASQAVQQVPLNVRTAAPDSFKKLGI